MFDEDELNSDYSLYSVPCATSARVAEAKAEAASLDLPFDLTNVLDYNPYIFGDLGDTDRIGRYVRYKGGTITTLSGKTEIFASQIALIVGDEFGRVVLAFEDQQFGWTYLGWVTDDAFDNVYIHEASSSWKH